MHGTGRRYYINGIVYEQVYEKGKLVKEKKI